MKDSVENEEFVLDTSGTECPIPVLKARKLASELNKDTIIKIIATDPLAEADFEHYCDQSNYEYLSCEKIKDKIIIRYRFKIKN
ncbi:sulfurtransferase TusA family protein [Pelagibacteraceae bacterium]|nr:sulfurtransferase TusA family protein [Pelagibacteraceae bacterium]